jgi:hypothetical protein
MEYAIVIQTAKVFLASVMGLCMSVQTVLAQENPVPLGNESIATGVYWPGEFTHRDLQIPKLRWQAIEKTLDLLAANHVNTIWLTHVDAKEGAQFARLAQARGIRLIASLGELDKQIGWNRPDIMAKMLEAWGDAPAPLAWGLGDEPLSSQMERMGQYIKPWKQAKHPVATVVMPGDVPACATQMVPSMFAVDAYAFFSDKNPSGPSDYASSTTYYLDSAASARVWARRGGVPEFWMMPQIFSEVWGPRDIDKDGNIVYLPGGGPHWRMPTEAEVRWQTWSGLSQGARGIVFFSLFFDAKAAPDAKQPVPPLAFAVTQPINSKLPAGILYLDGRPTPLLGAMGESFARVAKVAPVLATLRYTDEPLAFTSKGWRPAGQVVSNFLDTKGGNYALVVSGDFVNESEIAVNIDPRFSKVTDLVNGQSIEVLNTEKNRWEPKGPFKQIRVKLASGDGTLLKLE